MDKLQTGTIKSFQGIRFLAFMGIFLGHVDVSLGKLAGTCVTIFFVLSGYVMYSKYRNMDLDTGFVSLINFGWKRIRSLYPLHILTMLSLIP
jgi:peptidoglycan/LPS O-acetylase OafA/YrhL